MNERKTEIYTNYATLCVAVALAASTGSPVCSKEAGKRVSRPAGKLNIVVLLADDQGWSEPGCYGGGRGWSTPAIDGLAASGLRFTSAYSAGPVCSPTRASLMTGKQPARLHLTTVPSGKGKGDSEHMNEPKDWISELPSGAITVAQSLREAGYVTAQVGKWHLGASPVKFGFDVSLAGSGSRWATMSDKKKWVPQEEYTPGAVFFDEVKAREALHWVEVNRHKPFFLYVGFSSVHGPHDCTPDLIKRFASEPSPQYAGMQVQLDSAVATILNGLTRLGLDERTAVIYLSDNGAQKWPDLGLDNKPLRGGKGTTYEGGVRVPWIMRVPGHTRPGTTSDALISTCDLFPTVLELAGLPLQPEQHRDGISLVPCLGDPARAVHQTLAWHYPHHLALARTDPFGMMGSYRDGPLKLVINYDTGKQELFDIVKDIGETHDLSGELPNEAARLSAAFKSWKREVGAQEPTPKDR